MKISLINQCKKIAKSTPVGTQWQKKWKNFFAKSDAKCTVRERERHFFEKKVFDFFDIGAPRECFFHFFCLINQWVNQWKFFFIN